MAARVLMVGNVVPPQQMCPQGRRVQPGARTDRGHGLRRDTDIHDAQAAAAAQSLDGVMAGLGAKERYGRFRLEGPAHDFPGVAVQAGRHVHRDDGQPSLGHQVDGRGDFTVERSAESGAENGVDDQRRIVEPAARPGVDRALPRAGGPGGISPERLSLPEENEAHGPACRPQVPRGDKPVATVVARSAENEDGTARMTLHGRDGHRPSRPFHELAPRHTALDGEGIGPRHLCAGQKSEFVPGKKVAKVRHGGLATWAIGAADRI